MTDTTIIVQDVEKALESLNTSLPTVLAVVGTFYPPAAALAKFIPLIQIAIQAVETVAKATGTDASTATATVAQHLTPGAPNSPTLS